MKILIALLLMSGMISFMSAQTSFTINNIHGPNNEFISDMQYANSRYYALSVNTEAEEPYRTSSTLMLFNDSGQLTYQVQLGEEGYQFFRIVSIHLDKLQLVGSIKSDSCSSNLILSEYDISEGTLTNLAQYNLCDGKYVHSIRIVPGLDEEKFLEAVYSPDESDYSEFNHRTMFFELGANTINLIPDLQEYDSHLSIDFSGKGYIVRWGFVCEYYDQNFNHKYQYNNNTSGYAREFNSFIQPLVNHYLLEHVLYEDDDDYSKSEEIRLIDSNLHTKKLAIIDPQPNSYGVRIPLYGGIAFGSYNSIWATANFGDQYDLSLNYFSIIRLDSDLKIVCDHFIGFDATYKIFGISAFEDNGAIVYGWIKQDSHDYDIYVFKIGNECELSTSINGPQNPLHSISAYPNPGINDLTFDVNGFDPATLRVEIINESGQVLFNAKDLTNSIDVPELPPGQYFYRILQNDRLLGVGAWVKQ